MLNQRNTYNGLTYLKILFRRPLFGSGNTRQFFFELSNEGLAKFFFNILIRKAMDKYKEQKLNELFNAAESLNGLFNQVYQLALKSGCPNVLKAELYENTDALQNSIFRIAQFLAMPNAEEFSPMIKEKVDLTEKALKMAFVE